MNSEILVFVICVEVYLLLHNLHGYTFISLNPLIFFY